MKKIQLFLLLIIATVVIAACGTSQSDDKQTNSDQQKEKLIIGVDDQFAPMGFRDENNELVGFDIDLAKNTAEKMGVEVEFKPIDWKTKESELSSGRIDLIWNGYTITEERKKKVLFTKPYLTNAQVVVTLKDSPITSLDDLDGKKVGLQSLSSAENALSQHPISEKVDDISKYANNVLALTDLKAGRIDAVVIDEVVIDYYMSKEKETFQIIDESLAPEEYGVGVRKNDKELLEKLQTTLDQLIADGTASEVSEKWFGEDKFLKAK